MGNKKKMKKKTISLPQQEVITRKRRLSVNEKKIHHIVGKEWVKTAGQAPGVVGHSFQTAP